MYMQLREKYLQFVITPPVGSPLKSKNISINLPYKEKFKILMVSAQCVTYKSGGIFVVKSSRIAQACKVSLLILNEQKSKKQRQKFSQITESQLLIFHWQLKMNAFVTESVHLLIVTIKRDN